MPGQLHDVRLIVDFEDETGERFELFSVDGFARPDALKRWILREVAGQHGLNAPLVLDEIEPFQTCDVRFDGVVRVRYVEYLRRDARSWRELLVLHDTAQITADPFQVVDLNAAPKLLVA